MFRRYFTISFAIALGVCTALMTSAVIAQVLNGTLSVFQSGRVVSAAQINENFRLLREAVEKNGAAVVLTRQAPVGSIVAWHRNLGSGAPALPGGWLECNGQVVNDSESVFDGIAVPDLNGQLRFLRGNNVSGVLQADAFQGHYHLRNPAGLAESHSIPGTGISWAPNIAAAESIETTTGNPVSNGVNGAPRFGSETRPTNMSVVWIIKIK